MYFSAPFSAHKKTFNFLSLFAIDKVQRMAQKKNVPKRNESIDNFTHTFTVIRAHNSRQRIKMNWILIRERWIFFSSSSSFSLSLDWFSPCIQGDFSCISVRSFFFISCVNKFNLILRRDHFHGFPCANGLNFANAPKREMMCTLKPQQFYFCLFSAPEPTKWFSFLYSFFSLSFLHSQISFFSSSRVSTKMSWNIFTSDKNTFSCTHKMIVCVSFSRCRFSCLVVCNASTLIRNIFYLFHALDIFGFVFFWFSVLLDNIKWTRKLEKMQRTPKPKKKNVYEKIFPDHSLVCFLHFFSLNSLVVCRF